MFDNLWTTFCETALSVQYKNPSPLHNVPLSGDIIMLWHSDLSYN